MVFPVSLAEPVTGSLMVPGSPDGGVWRNAVNFVVEDNPNDTSPASTREGTLGQEVRALIVLSLPLAVARLGSVFMGFVDTVMAGRIGPRAIAALALANTVFFLAFIAAMGTLMALEPIIARAVGAGDDEHARSALNTGRYVAVALGVAIAALMLVAPSILAALGQPPDLVEIVDEYLMLVAIGAVPGLLFNAYTAHVNRDRKDEAAALRNDRCQRPQRHPSTTASSTASGRSLSSASSASRRRRSVV